MNSPDSAVVIESVKTHRDARGTCSNR